MIQLLKTACRATSDNWMLSLQSTDCYWSDVCRQAHCIKYHEHLGLDRVRAMLSTWRNVTACNSSVFAVTQAGSANVPA